MCRKLLSVVVMVCLCIVASVVHATTIDIDIANPGFESGSGYGVNDWTTSGAGAEDEAGNLAPHGGSRMAWINAPSGGLSQILKVGVDNLHVNAGDQIAINVFQGLRDDQDNYLIYPQAFQISLWKGAVDTGTLFGASDVFGNVLPFGTWALRSYTYTATSAAVGADLYLKLGMTPDTSVQIVLDDVSGTYTPTPEPGTLILLTTGLLGLLCYAWRKRR